RELLTPIALRPLRPQAVEALVASLLAEGEDGSRLAPLLMRESQGSPLFIAELLKLLKAQSVIVARGHGYALTRDPSVESIPEGMRSVIRRRIDRLTPEERELADIASV